MENSSFDAKKEGQVPQEDGKSQERKTVSEGSPKRKRKPTLEDLKKQLENEKQVAQDNYEKFLRAYADLENYKKRAEKEKVDNFRYATEELIRDLLPFVDNLERAVEHASSETDNNPQALIEGVELTLKDLIKVLEKHGLQPIESVGKPFDPNLHEAMMQVENEEYEPQTVVEEFQKGYLIRDRLLRPARVSVAMGSKATREGETEGEVPSVPDE